MKNKVNLNSNYSLWLGHTKSTYNSLTQKSKWFLVCFTKIDFSVAPKRKEISGNRGNESVYGMVKV